MLRPMSGTRERLDTFLEAETGDSGKFPVYGLAWPDEHAPVVLVSPAMGTPASFYGPFVRALHEAGATALVFDHRGNGGRRYVSRTTGYPELVADLSTAITSIRSQLPGAATVVCGHSLGGQIALLQAAVAAAGRRDGVPDAIALVAAGSAHHRAFESRSTGLLVSSQFMALTAALLGHWPGDRVGFGGRQPAGVILDWAHQARTGRYRLDGMHVEAMLPALELPVLAVDVAGDRLAPPTAVSHLCGKIPAARLERRAYTSADAEGAVLDHFRWVRHGAPLARDLVRWANETVK